MLSNPREAQDLSGPANLSAWLGLAARVLASPHVEEAFAVLIGALAEPLRLRHALWVGPDGDVRLHWPERAVFDASLLERFGVQSSPADWPAAEGVAGGEELLRLPLDGAGSGTLVLVAQAGALGTDAARWQPIAALLAQLIDGRRRLEAAEQAAERARQRAEEGEALHVLGLAVNRSLDPDEVLSTVARLTQRLMGASYVTVTIAEGARARTLAAIGLRSAERLADQQDPVAMRVLEARKPLMLGADSEVRPDRFALHSAEGMQTGLAVPLSLFGELLGALVVGYRRSCTLSARDRRLAIILASHAAVAVSNARLHRALALRSQELERANEALRWTSRSKERFFASMSHELRTPLNAVLGYQSLVLDEVVGEVPETLRPFLERSQRATRTLLYLVNDVLDLSKIEAGKIELLIRPVPLRELVEDAAATIAPLASAKSIRLRIAPPDFDVVLQTDEDRLRQILLNLLSNAVKFTDAGEVSLDVAVEPALSEGAPAPGAGAGRPPADDGAWVEIRVTDTGPGIRPEHHERIFLEFEQVGPSPAREGTGLGLSISRKLARLLGGDLTVHSEPGAGSVFVLRIPVIGAPSGPGVAPEGGPG